MRVINVRNAHEALPEAIRIMAQEGVQRPSRNGPVLMHPVPVTTCYECPTERVVYWPQRDANPFFHLFEALWMLGGRDDVAYVTRFVKNMAQFSDDGERFHGAYGFRWRHLRGIDQLAIIAERLRANRDDRRQVAQMFDAELDLVSQEGMKDIPCNLTLSFQVNVEGNLDLTVFCRSNDIIWGCYGANAVHFSVLLEYMAARVGIFPGRYWQVSVNWHAYLKTFEPLIELAGHAKNPYASRFVSHSPYDTGEVRPHVLVQDPDRFDAEVQVFLDEGYECMGYRERFLRKVAIPMLRAHDIYRTWEGSERFEAALERLRDMPHGNDWRKACEEWIRRRQARSMEKERNDGGLQQASQP